MMALPVAPSRIGPPAGTLTAVPIAAHRNLAYREEVPYGVVPRRHMALPRTVSASPVSVAHPAVASNAPSRASTPRREPRNVAVARDMSAQACLLQRSASPLMRTQSPQTPADKPSCMDSAAASHERLSPSVQDPLLAQQVLAPLRRAMPACSRDCSPLFARPLMPAASTAPQETGDLQQASCTRDLQVPVAPSVSRAGTPGPRRGISESSANAQRQEDARVSVAGIGSARSSSSHAGAVAVDVDLASIRIGPAEAVLARPGSATSEAAEHVEPPSSRTLPPQSDRAGKPMICIPESHKAGQPVAIRTAAGLVLLPLPPGAKPGDEILFDVADLPSELVDHGQDANVRDNEDEDRSSCGDTETDVMTLCGTLPDDPAVHENLPHAQQARVSDLAGRGTEGPVALSRLSLRSRVPPPAPSSPPRKRTGLRAVPDTARAGCESAPCSPPPRSAPSPSPLQPTPVSKGPGGPSHRVEPTALQRSEKRALPPTPPLSVPQLGKSRGGLPPPPPSLSTASAQSSATQVASVYPKSPQLDERLLLHGPRGVAGSTLPPHSGPLSPPRRPRATVAKEAVAPITAAEATDHGVWGPPDTLAEIPMVQHQSARAAALDDQELSEESPRRTSHLRCAGLSGAGAPPPPKISKKEEEPETSTRGLENGVQAQSGRGPGKPQSWPLPVGGAGRLPPPPNFIGTSLGPDPTAPTQSAASLGSSGVPGPSTGIGLCGRSAESGSLQTPCIQPFDVGLGGFAPMMNPGCSGLASMLAVPSLTPPPTQSNVFGGASWDLKVSPPSWTTSVLTPPPNLTGNGNCFGGWPNLHDPGSCFPGTPDNALAAKLYQRFGLDDCMPFEKFAAQLMANKDSRASPACGGA